MNSIQTIKRVKNIIEQYTEGAIMYSEAVNAILNTLSDAVETEDYIESQQQIEDMFRQT